jgi:hypothetical protein
MGYARAFVRGGLLIGIPVIPIDTENTPTSVGIAPFFNATVALGTAFPNIQSIKTVGGFVKTNKIPAESYRILNDVQIIVT